MVKDLLVFDMDGVLVDVHASYRATIQQTVADFTGVAPSHDVIQSYKNQGGWNDDWALSHRLIQDAGHTVPYQDVVDHFQRLFHGGMMARERWIASDGLLEKLTQTHHLTVFTGRLRWEANLTLERYAPHLFSLVVGVDDVLHAKPAPEGLLKIRDRYPDGRIWYLGDTVDDARAARAAQVPFIGIATPELAPYLEKEGAMVILQDINSLPSVLKG